MLNILKLEILEVKRNRLIYDDSNNNGAIFFDKHYYKSSNLSEN